MTHPVSRRAALCLSIALPQGLLAAALSTRHWLVGEWRSDAQRSLASRSAGGRLLTPEQKQARGVLYGNLTYQFTRREFILADALSRTRQSTAYTVVSETDSSIELRIRANGASPVSLVLYRESDDWLFVRNRTDLEYFQRQRG